MAEERLTPAELRQRQEEREREAEENERNAREERSRAAEDADRERGQAAKQKVIANWYPWVVAAAKHDRVRFVVVAHVIGRETSEIVEARAAVSAEGYKTDLVNISLPASGGGRAHGRPNTSDDVLVTDGQEFGWQPANVPMFGSQGTNLWLVVRW